MCAFLDDVYLLCPPSRVQPLHKVWTEALSRHAGIQLYQVKTKTWNQAGIVPENVENLGPAAWQPEGVTVLGTLIRSPQYVARRKMDERISEERELWMAIPTVPICSVHGSSWFKARNPRANHTMRTMPPSQSAAYCRAHGAGIRHTAMELLEDIPCDREAEARQLST